MAIVERTQGAVEVVADIVRGVRFAGRIVAQDGIGNAWQVQQRGVVLGSLLAIWRILRCNPWAQGGVDEVKAGSGKFLVTKTGFVVPKPKKG